MKRREKKPKMCVTVAFLKQKRNELEFSFIRSVGAVLMCYNRRNSIRSKIILAQLNSKIAIVHNLKSRLGFNYQPNKDF